MTIHTRSVFDRQLVRLQANVVRLSSLVEQAVERSIDALQNRNLALSQSVIVGDHQVNRLRYTIEEDALLTLATQQPRASDLRRVIAAIHIAIELERMGDHAVGIAKLVERIERAEELQSLHKLPKMAQRVNKMTRLAIDAYVSEDAEAARDMMVRDRKVNRHYYKTFDLLLGEMRDEQYVERATYLMWMGHNLERIGDRAVNIAERVIFMTTGNLTESMTTDYDIT